MAELEHLKEECGVFGMYDFSGGDVATSIYYGLFALQHRGQESCGIAVSDTNGPKGKVSRGQCLSDRQRAPEFQNSRRSSRTCHEEAEGCVLFDRYEPA